MLYFWHPIDFESQLELAAQAFHSETLLEHVPACQLLYHWKF